VEFLVHRRHNGSFFHAFDRREPDWWREGAQWIDHGGIACVLASNWISLVAPEGKGLLWHKRPVGPDVFVGFEIGENTEWFGWDKSESHVHYSFDNICIHLAPERHPDQGYRLEVNAENRTKTILYRNGKAVAEVAQDGNFPIHYRGGHAPNSPRKNRIGLVKRGPLLRAIVNGKEVLKYSDPAPIDVRYVAVGGHKTRVNFANISVISLAEAAER